MFFDSFVEELDAFSDFFGVVVGENLFECRLGKGDSGGYVF